MDRIPSKLDFLRGLLKGMELNGSKKNVIIEEIIEILELLYEEIHFCREDCEREELEVEEAAGEGFPQADDFEDKTMKRTDFKTPAGMADVWFDESLTVAKRPEKPAGAGTSVPVYNAKTVMEKICKHCGTYIRAEFSFDESKRVKIQCPKCKHFILPEDTSPYESLKEHAFNWDDLEERKESGFVFDDEDDFDEMDDVASIIQEAHSFSVDVSEVEQFQFSGAAEEDGLSFEELHGINVETPCEEDEELPQEDLDEAQETEALAAEEALELKEEEPELLCEVEEEEAVLQAEQEADTEAEAALDQLEQDAREDAAAFAAEEARSKDARSEQAPEFGAQRPYYGPQGQAPYYPNEYPQGPEFYAAQKADPYRAYPRPEQVFYPPYPYVDPYSYSMQRMPVGYYPPQAAPYQNDFAAFSQHGMNPQQAPYRSPFPGSEQPYAGKFQQERQPQVNTHRDVYEQMQGGAESRYEDFAAKEALFNRPSEKKSMYQEEQIAESEEPESDLSLDYETEFQSFHAEEDYADMPLPNEGLYDFGTEVAEQAEHVIGTEIEDFKIFENNYADPSESAGDKASVVEFNRGALEEDLHEEADAEMDDEEFFRRQFEDDDLLEEESDFYEPEHQSVPDLESDEELNQAYEILKPELSPADEMDVYRQEEDVYTVNEEADRMEDGILFGEFEMEAPRYEEDVDSYYDKARAEEEEGYFQPHTGEYVTEEVPEQAPHQTIDVASIFSGLETVSDSENKEDLGVQEAVEEARPVSHPQANPTYNPLGKFEGNKMANIGDVIDSITEAYHRKKTGASNPAPQRESAPMEQVPQQEVGRQKSIPAEAKQGHDKKSKKENGKIFGRMFKKS